MALKTSLPTAELTPFFKPKENASKMFLITDAKDLGVQQYGTQYAAKETVEASIHIFDSATAAKPASVQRYLIQGNLYKALAEFEADDAMFATLGQVPTSKGNPAWVWNVHTATEEQAAYYSKLEEAAKKEAEERAAARASAPDFN